MKASLKSYYLQLILSMFLSIYCAVDEGNIYVPLISNFTLEHSEHRINNKNYYTIPLYVGTPEEEYDVQVDTSTATSWIPSGRCQNCILAHRLYEEEYSRTSSPTDKLLKIEDEDGNVEGYEISDNIQLGGYKLKQYSFVQVTKVADDFRDHYQGKLGLGYKSHYIKDQEFNFLEKLKKNNLIMKKIFSINAINEKKGMLFIGDIPGKEYNTYCNVTTDIDDLDDMYKESWICHLTHVGVFNTEKGIFNQIKYYEELEHNDLVNFDSAYDYISVPISEKDHIKKLLETAQLDCREERSKQTSKVNDPSLRNRIKEKEISIVCKTSVEKLQKKNMALSFVLQGYSYSIPLNLLFSQNKNSNEMEMLIKYIDDEAAIWTFGYPFMNQFLMIFNMEDNHVGIKKLKKTVLPIINLSEKNVDIKEESSDSGSGFKTFGYIILFIVVLAIIFFIYHAIRKRNVASDGSKENKEMIF